MNYEREMLKATLAALNSACQEDEAINQNAHIGRAIENLKHLMDHSPAAQVARE